MYLDQRGLVLADLGREAGATVGVPATVLARRAVVGEGQPDGPGERACRMGSEGKGHVG